MKTEHEAGKCCYCGKTKAEIEALRPDDDLRPYGPDGADVCYECAHATADRAKVAGDEIDRRLSYPGNIMIDVNGIHPFPSKGST